MINGTRPKMDYPPQVKLPREPQLLLDELKAPEGEVPKDAIVEILL